MDQQSLKNNLNGLERKILVLLNEYRAVKDEVKKLKLENHELENNLKKRDEQLSHFKNQIKITKIVEHINAGDGSFSELKTKVDEYIREIDKCIAHLSR